MGNRSSVLGNRVREYMLDKVFKTRRRNAALFVSLILFHSNFCLGAYTAPVNQIVAPSVVNPSLQNVEALSALGQVWVFLKYHHPDVAAGKYDWDKELLTELPKIMAENTRTTWQRELERWVSRYPQPGLPTIYRPATFIPEARQVPDYGDLFSPGFLPKSLVKTLRNILKNGAPVQNRYVRRGYANNTDYSGEQAYAHMDCPDQNYRLLALFRYWGAVQYFYPYRYRLGREWPAVLNRLIPVFLQAGDRKHYIRACDMLLASLHDTHTWITDHGAPYTLCRGQRYTAFRAGFIGEQLVVQNVSRMFAGKVSRGDVVTHIAGTPVPEIVAGMGELMGSSNGQAQLRRVGESILCGPSDRLELTLQGKGTVTVPRYSPVAARWIWRLFGKDDDKPSAYKLINGDIGYVNVWKYNEAALPAMQRVFKGTKGIIVDMRGYPVSRFDSLFCAYVKESRSPFAKISIPDMQKPGLFVSTETVSCGTQHDSGPHHNYDGKVVVLVNAVTQSAAEYSVMALQSSRRTVVVGSTTAGADGNVSIVPLPGGLGATFTGNGVYYPDGGEAQGNGVRIDVPVSDTLDGFRQGRDEQLEKAVELIRGSR